MRFFVLTGIFRLYILHLTPSTKKKHPKSDFFLLFSKKITIFAPVIRPCLGIMFLGWAVVLSKIEP